ncbi:MAG: DUF1015 family protein, partial [Acidimicrobiia bacterium]|nr:DUF1015 family protein [Acidimicrobiia bacterium]
PEDIARIQELVAQEPVVLADGHHRFETAIAYRDERRAAGIVDDADDAVMCLVVELTDEQLWVQPIHRLLDGVSSPTGLRLKLGERFRIVDATANTPEAVGRMMTKIRTEGGVALVDGEGLARLVPDADDLEAARGTIEPELGDVPSAWFDAVAGDALTGLDITYRHDAHAIAAMVEARTVDAAILLAPVTVDQIRAAAKARVRMPQKTTFFAPKPRTGLVFRSLDEA